MKPGRKKNIPLKSSIAVFLANQIERDYSNSDFSLPSLRNLAENYNVSLPTMLKAAKLLRKSGFIIYSQGAKPQRISKNKEHAVSPVYPKSQKETIHTTLRNQIQSGEIKNGQVLPKITYLMAHYHVSYKTVSECLSRLYDESLIYRKGNSFIAGKQTLHNALSHYSYVGIVMPKMTSWESLYNSERTRNFTIEFMKNLNNARCKVIWILANEKLKSRSNFQNIISGIKDFKKWATNISTGLRGILVVGKTEQYDDFPNIIYQLCKICSKVIWFNASAENESTLVHYHNKIAICSYKENALTNEAVSFLKNADITSALYIYEPDNAWQITRRDLLIQSKDEIFKELRLTCHPVIYSNEYINDKPTNKISQIVQDLISKNKLNYENYLKIFDEQKEKVASFIKTFCPEYSKILHLPYGSFLSFSYLAFLKDSRLTIQDKLPELYSKGLFIWDAIILYYLLQSPKGTTLIAPNDAIGRRYLSRLHEMDIKIPEEYSILSFDNIYSQAVNALTSIDIGFSNLGYNALHFILDDINVKRDNQGHIFSTPFVFRGSTL